MELLSDKDTEQSISLWNRCPSCNELVFKGELERDFYICPYCGHLFPLSVNKRVEQLLESMPAATLPVEGAALTGTISGYPVSLFVEGTGDISPQINATALLTAIDNACNQRIPLITVASGQSNVELLSISQITYLASEIEKLAEMSLPHITVLTETDAVPLVTRLPVGELVIAEQKVSAKKNRAVNLQPALHAPEEQLLAQTTGSGETVRLKTEGALSNMELAPDINVDCYISREELPNLLGKFLKFFAYQPDI